MNEEREIKLMGQTCVQNPGKRVGIVFDNEEKSQRYLDKLLKDFPSIIVLAKHKDAPFKGSYSFVLTSGTKQ